MTKIKFAGLVILTVLSLSMTTPLIAQKATTKKETIKSAISLYEKYIDDSMDRHLKEFCRVGVYSKYIIYSIKQARCRKSGFMDSKQIKIHWHYLSRTFTYSRKSGGIWQLG